jgi:hypothetical protein
MRDGIYRELAMKGRKGGLMSREPREKLPRSPTEPWEFERNSVELGKKVENSLKF